MWVINRVHNHAAYMRATAKPAITASLTNFDVLLVRV
jgi:hypothetical protein